MEDLIESITRNNVTEVKVVLTSVVAALALYQVTLMLVGYGKVKIRSLSPKAASFAHRASGDAIVTITVVIGIMCLGYYGMEDDATFHMIAGWALAAALVLKVVVVRWWHGLGRYLPMIGSTVFALFLVTWWSSAGFFFWGD